MFWPDIPTLHAFYAGPPGQWAGRCIRRMIRRRLPRHFVQNTLIVGYGIPYLSLFQDRQRRLIQLLAPNQWEKGSAGMPRQQAPDPLPHSALCVDETRLPFPDECMDRVLVLHACEHADAPSAMLAEIARISTPQARLLFIVPNRNGLWARAEHTPFSLGRPFGAAQFCRGLEAQGLSVDALDYLLYPPPWQRRTLLRIAPALETLGGRLLPFMGGLIAVTAGKTRYADIPEPLRQPQRIPGYSSAAQGAFSKAARSPAPPLPPNTRNR